MKQPKMSMSLDRLFFFWRKGDSLLIEKREQDLFERMKNCIGCTYISDLPRYRYEVWEKMKRISWIFLCGSTAVPEERKPPIQW